MTSDDKLQAFIDTLVALRQDVTNIDQRQQEAARETTETVRVALEARRMAQNAPLPQRRWISTPAIMTLLCAFLGGLVAGVFGTAWLYERPQSTEASNKIAYAVDSQTKAMGTWVEELRVLRMKMDEVKPATCPSASTVPAKTR